ncbi:tRNA dihydrouridine synthase DusB [candidate division KSB1 bacterium]
MPRKHSETPVTIGNVKIRGIGVLAPLAGVTDIPFRLLCKEMGTPLVCSEMVSSEGLVRGSEKTNRYLDFLEEERPIALQLFGSDPDTMKRAARILEEQRRPDFIDINFGCPVKKVVRNEAGSALLKDPDRMFRIAEAMVKEASVPVTAKIRSGWDGNSAPVSDIGKMLEDAGVAAITIHARTRAQQFQGKVRWEDIAELKNAVSVPVIGNGDVRTAPDAEQMLDQTGCDLVMIGRAAMGNPWIFREIDEYFSSGALPPPPGFVERIDICLKQFGLSVEIYGAKKSSFSMKKHVGWYVKGIPGNAAVKQRVFESRTAEEMMNVLSEYRETLKNNRRTERFPPEHVLH